MIIVIICPFTLQLFMIIVIICPFTRQLLSIRAPYGQLGLCNATVDVTLGCSTA